jgi:hypothetical protein
MKVITFSAMIGMQLLVQSEVCSEEIMVHRAGIDAGYYFATGDCEL